MYASRLLPLASALLLPALLHAQAPAPAAAPTGQPDPTELGEIVIEGKAESLIGEAPSASKGQTSMKELLERPFSRRGELLESVPGVIITQHSGDGKANQYFVRGANLDHGTDFLMYVDGMPVNFRNHAHGQGYADLNFIIPELVGELEYWKGNYYAQHGDLSSSGAARFKLVDELPHGILTSTWGEYEYTRTLIADTIQAGAGKLTVALEHQFYNGPWELNSDATRWNGFMRWHWQDSTDKINITMMGYQGDWTSTDQVPQRAIDGGLIGRYGFIDPSNGGNSRRYSLSFDWQRQEGRTTTRASAYAGYYDLDLFSNFTYNKDNAVGVGDQFEQQDQRWFLGGEIARDLRFDALGHEQRFTLGFQLRAEWMNGLGLYNTTNRERFNEIRKDDIFQASYGLFSEFEFKPVQWLRIIPGVRADLIHFDVQQSSLNENQGTLSKGIVSPKLNIVFGPWAKTEFYINGGMGFHSNDARGVNIVTNPDPAGDPVDRADPLVRTYGVEFGIRNESIPRLVNTFSLWALRSDSELIYVGDAAAASPAPPPSATGSRSPATGGLPTGPPWMSRPPTRMPTSAPQIHPAMRFPALCLTP